VLAKHEPGSSLGRTSEGVQARQRVIAKDGNVIGMPIPAHYCSRTAADECIQAETDTNIDTPGRLAPNVGRCCGPV